jgi:hypothetical protein
MLRRGGDPGDALVVGWDEPVDRQRWFICPTVTPLYYAPVYGQLTRDEQLAYNHLTAVYFNELIAYFETSFAVSVLAAVGRAETDAHDPQFGAALKQFVADEQEHTRWWRQLTRLSRSNSGDGDQAPLFRISRTMAALLSKLLARPRMFSAAFWVMLVLEERSLDISRRSLRRNPEEMEPLYREVYRKHMEHEAAHVALDCELIERYFAPRSRLMRQLNARLFRTTLRRFLLPPVRGGKRVVQRLLEERPRLVGLHAEIFRQLDAVGNSAEYQRMMYSRESTPIAFSLFDRFAEMHSLSRVLHCYAPADGRIGA